MQPIVSPASTSSAGDALMKRQLALLLFVPSVLFAQSRFDGTWEMKMDTIQFSNTPEEYLLDEGVYHCLTCVPKVDVKADGTDQKVDGHAYFDTYAVRVVDANSVEFTSKKAGKTTFVAVEIVSPDGNTMTEEFTNTIEAQTVTGKAMFTRASKGPIGAHALSGSWIMRTVRNDSSSGPTSTYQATKDGLTWSDSNSQSYDAKFDGKDYAVQGDPSHTMVSLRWIDEDTIEQTEKQDGKVIRVTRMTVANDGKSMKVETTAQRGTTMTYTAEKQR
jgi:hypothetical protein